MGIYIIRAGSKGPIKIGFTGHKNPEQRLSQIRTSTFMEIRLLAFIEGTAEDEGKLHRRFQKHRMRGEWFAPSPELLKFLKSLPPPPETLRKSPGRYGLWKHMTDEQREAARLHWISSEHSTDVAAAAAAGIPHTTLRIQFGPSGRVRKLSAEAAKSMAEARHAEKRKALMPKAQAIKIWRASRYKRYEDALKHMPGWNKMSAYNELGPRNTGTGRPRKS